MSSRLPFRAPMRLALVLAMLVMALAFSGTALADPGPAPVALCATGSQPTPTPCSTDWYIEPVTVSWTWEERDPAGTADAGSCAGGSVTEPGTEFSCTVNWPDMDPSSATVFVKKVTATPDRLPDVDGWYTSPVAITFSAPGASCDPVPPYSGPDSPTAVVSTTCTDGAENSAPASFEFKYDGTAPTVTEALARPPDYNSWYNHPVEFSFNGTDGAGSGGVVCGTKTYNGPEGEGVQVTGSCTDAVGHVGTGSFPLNYDATPPTLTNLTAADGDSEVTLTWVASADTTSLDLVRSAAGEPDKNIDLAGGAAAGGPGAYTDTTASNGTHYTYTVTAHDRADNRAPASIGADPTAAAHDNGPVQVIHVSPITKKVAALPVLRWRKVKGARYYNVQLYRGRVKILSIWPRTNRLQLKRSWTYARKKRSLSPGTYKWYVWPGFGARKAAKYGTLLKKDTFRVKR
jgi:hypothetical protein